MINTYIPIGGIVILASPQLPTVCVHKLCVHTHEHMMMHAMCCVKCAPHERIINTIVYVLYVRTSSTHTDAHIIHVYMRHILAHYVRIQYPHDISHPSIPHTPRNTHRTHLNSIVLGHVWAKCVLVCVLCELHMCDIQLKCVQWCVAITQTQHMWLILCACVCNSCGDYESRVRLYANGVSSWVWCTHMSTTHMCGELTCVTQQHTYTHHTH